ncbi:MAG: hypothetical protein SangKO_042430 [Sandaracinaceae bacterium]|nr:MAG: flavin-nucleotide-binding protein [Sandaracinaceae bacterium]
MTDTPFHDGELEAQGRMGVREQVHQHASRFIRTELPAQHREFYASQPMLVVGSVSDDGAPTASALFGRPGFATARDERHLAVNARPVEGDPLAERLAVGAGLGVLGIDLRTRRRNRVNGRVTAATGDGFELRVDQAFGNCPQHIRVRAMELAPEIDLPLVPRARHEAARLDSEAAKLVSRADAFFIASAYPGSPGDPRRGVDASHRGGAPGFVRVESERTLLFPDFGGNRLYNTIGNLLRHAPVGLLFVDFVRGDLVQIEGRAVVLWEDPLLEAYDGAERFVRIHVERVRTLEGVVPIRFGAPTPSRNEALVGSWAEARAALSAIHEGREAS